MNKSKSMVSQIQTLFLDCIEAAIKWLKRIWFESKLKARLQMIEWQNKIEFEKELEENFKPIYREGPAREPGTEAAKLGGPMRLTSKWMIEDTKTNETN